jgi:hypothetical protein
MRRPRGPGGRFLTAKELQEMAERGEYPPGFEPPVQTQSPEVSKSVPSSPKTQSHSEPELGNDKKAGNNDEA